MTTLAEHIIVAGVENRPPMLEKSMYDSWASLIRLFIKGKKMLINDMHTIGMTMQQVQVNTKFLNALPLEWSKFVTNVKYLDPLALVANSQTLYNPSQSPQHSVPSMHPPPQHLVVPTFQQGEDPIDYINKVMTFLSAIASRFLPSNNQLRTSLNPQNQAIIQDGIATTSRGNYTAGQPRVVKCYNCLREGHKAKQYTQPKRPRNSAWFKEKLMLVEAQEAGQILDEEKLAFIADPGIEEAPVAQQTIPHNSTFQTEDLDAYDSDCDDISLAKAVLMANLSSCDSDVLFEVPYSDTYPNDMINQDVHEMHILNKHILLIFQIMR
ncbi:retrovirus-related pol polyprotein from transposon TNT 1-94 [Tanacetum coccineum]|uniref:Retrovirus-related pol polyprotein from transposon TNT 1-94 n=1 Tax=Tanacetum coccineum TaxID=301880 RepID=A0ABQ5FL99_9ASTR